MEFIKQSGVGHKVERLYIHWDITTVCDYKCSYCYARKEYKDKWSRPGNWAKQQNVINELGKSSLPIFLGLLGGEPTSHYKYFDMLAQLYPIIDSNKDSRLYITTNGAKDTDFYKKHKYAVSNKYYFLFSLHPEYVNMDNYKTFVNNIQWLKELGYRIKVNVMLHPAKHYWNFLEFIIKHLMLIQDIEIHPHYIYSDVHSSIKYSEDFYKQFQFINELKTPEFIFETKDETFNFTDHTIFENKYNSFQNWNCWNNNYEINLDCQINQFCFSETKIDIPEDFFKNITEIEPTRCPHKMCSCDGLLKIYKEK